MTNHDEAGLPPRSADERPTGDDGFTLTELLIVIVILAVLAGVVIFSMRGVTGEAREASCTTERRTIESAVDSYILLNGTAPPTLDEAGLIDAGLLQSQSSLFDVQGATVVPQPGASTTCP